MVASRFPVRTNRRTEYSRIMSANATLSNDLDHCVAQPPLHRFRRTRSRVYSTLDIARSRHQGAHMIDSAPSSSVSSGVHTVTSVQNPLTLVMAIKSPTDAQALNALLQKIQSAPPAQNPIWAALNALNNVHFARFVFLEQNTKLAVITTYDGTFENYINEFIDAIGDVFNALLAHMSDAPTLPVQKNRQAFLDYVRANDLRAIEPFYSAYPRATVLDIKAALGN